MWALIGRVLRFVGNSLLRNSGVFKWAISRGLKQWITTKSFRSGFKAMFRTAMTRRFKFLSYLTDFTEAKKHGENPYKRLFMAILTNKLVPVEIRKMYYFCHGLTSKGKNDRTLKEIDESIEKVLSSMGVSARDMKDIKKILRARINTLDLKVVGQDFKKHINLWLKNPDISMDDKALFLKKFANALNDNELKQFQQEYLKEMIFIVKSSAVGFNGYRAYYSFQDKTLQITIKGDYSPNEKQYTYFNISYAQIVRAMNTPNFGSQFFWKELPSVNRRALPPIER